MKVGFVGLGRMGARMAANLLAGGHDVTVYNRSTSKARALVERGARVAADLADACRGDAVLTMLADDAAVESVVFGDGGILGSLGTGAIHVSMSTISVALSSGRRGRRPAALADRWRPDAPPQRFHAARAKRRPAAAADG
jgi:3-hydroxyisobutyrate dehydrogenase-like beta-hydroxyacid dehydrogenase